MSWGKNAINLKDVEIMEAFRLSLSPFGDNQELIAIYVGPFQQKMIL